MLTYAERLLVFTASLQFLQLPGMIIGQHYLGWRVELAQLSAVSRRLVLALGIGIVLYVVGTACLALLYSRAIVTSELGRGLCVLQSIAWSVRAFQQFWSIGPLWPKRVRWLHLSLTVIYSTLALSYSAIWLVLRQMPS